MNNLNNQDNFLARQAFEELFPEIGDDRNFILSYSSKFKGFNANVKFNSLYVHFNLSRKWKDFSDDLKKGLMQHLLIRIFTREKAKNTLELDLYYKFMANLGKYSKVEMSDPELERSFERINSKYFDGMLEKPNLVWGQDSFRKLGHYEYASNTVLLSSIFKGRDDLLDYIMYHELLHKKHGNKKTTTGRTIHHSTGFKKDEKLFEDKDAEKKLSKFIKKRKIRRFFDFF